MNTPFEITKEEVLELAAQKLADNYGDNGELADAATTRLRERIEEIIKTGIASRVDAFLDAEMRELLSKEIIPLTMWGEKAGEPTTLRDVLHKRALEFWDVRVDKDGRKSDWGGTPRHEHLMSKILQDEFAQAVKQNASTIVAAFKQALLADSKKLVEQHINALIK